MMIARLRIFRILPVELLAWRALFQLSTIPKMDAIRLGDVRTYDAGLAQGT
jgi:hypothetical protein